MVIGKLTLKQKRRIKYNRQIHSNKRIKGKKNTRATAKGDMKAGIKSHLSRGKQIQASDHLCEVNKGTADLERKHPSADPTEPQETDIS